MALAPEIDWLQYEQVVVMAPRLDLLGFVSTRALFCTFIFSSTTKSTASSTCELPSSFCSKQRYQKTLLVVSTKLYSGQSLFYEINNLFSVSFHLRSYLLLTSQKYIIIVSFYSKEIKRQIFLPFFQQFV
jgi:hypothetical protein